jgi:hypothetical protein
MSLGAVGRLGSLAGFAAVLALCFAGATPAAAITTLVQKPGLAGGSPATGSDRALSAEASRARAASQ